MNFFSVCVGSATKFLFLPVFQMLSDKHLICRSFCTLFPDWFYCLFNPKVKGFLGEQTLLIKAEHSQSLFRTTYGSVCRLPLMELSGTYDSIFMSWSCSSWFWRFLSKTKCIHHKTTFGIESWIYDFQVYDFCFSQKTAQYLLKSTAGVTSENGIDYQLLWTFKRRKELADVSFHCLLKMW